MIRAAVSARGHYLRVALSYDRAAIRTRIEESRELLQTETRIHGRAIKWIDRLHGHIRRELGRMAFAAEPRLGRSREMPPDHDSAAGVWARDAYRISERRACRALGACRGAAHYRSRRRQQEAQRKRLRDLAWVRIRAGYEQLHVFLRSEGVAREP